MEVISCSLFNDQAHLDIDSDKTILCFINITESLVQRWHLSQGLLLLQD